MKNQYTKWIIALLIAIYLIHPRTYLLYIIKQLGQADLDRGIIRVIEKKIIPNSINLIGNSYHTKCHDE